MMVETEELPGLSLSLSFPHHQRKLNSLSPINVHSSSINVNLLQKPTWSEALFHASPPPTATTTAAMDRSTTDNCRGETTRSFLRGFDVNLLPPTTTDCGVAGDDYAGISSPNSTVSSVSGKRSERSSDQIAAGDENDNEISRGISDEEDGETSRKKLRLSKDQSAVLEESFKEHNTLNPKQKLALAKQLGLRPRQVEVWFQNRRARTKLKQTEVDCEFLKRCCENLTEDNRRLQKEVQELRALKLSPQFYMQMTPPTTLTMCPSCERVAVPHHPAAQSRPAPNGLWRGPTAPAMQVRPFEPRP